MCDTTNKKREKEMRALLSKTTVEAWFNYFSTGDPRYFLEMMNSLEKDASES